MALLEKSIVVRMEFLGISRAALCQITGLREQSICPALKCTTPLSNVDAETILRTLTDLERLQEIAKPFEVPTRDTRKLKFLLSKMRDGDLDNLMTPIAKEVAAEMDRAH